MTQTMKSGTALRHGDVDELHGTVSIGAAAALSGASTKMIRYYDSIGLIAPPLRSAAGYRIYTADDVKILSFIHRARDFGFPIERIRALVGFWQSGKPSREVKRIALEQVGALNDRIMALQGMAEELGALAAACPGDDGSHCPILVDLAGIGPNTTVNGAGLGRGGSKSAVDQ